MLLLHGKLLAEDVVFGLLVPDERGRVAVDLATASNSAFVYFQLKTKIKQLDAWNASTWESSHCLTM